MINFVLSTSITCKRAHFVAAARVATAAGVKRGVNGIVSTDNVFAVQWIRSSVGSCSAPI